MFAKVKRYMKQKLCKHYWEFIPARSNCFETTGTCTICGKQKKMPHKEARSILVYQWMVDRAEK